LADLLFRRAETANTSIDDLLDLWAADVLGSGRTPPFSDHDDLHYVIDSIKEGRSSWNSFQVSYQGEHPADNVPCWMDEKFDVWHRDPQKVVQELLANTEFDGSFDYTPCQEFQNGKRCWSSFMSGNWAWKQAVRNLLPHIFSTNYLCFLGYYC
jgi:hypothetical protein